MNWFLIGLGIGVGWFIGGIVAVYFIGWKVRISEKREIENQLAKVFKNAPYILKELETDGRN